MRVRRESESVLQHLQPASQGGTFDPAARAQLNATLAERSGRPRPYDYAPLGPPYEDEPPEPFDAAAHAQTWDDMLRLQREGVYPQAFAAIRDAFDTLLFGGNRVVRVYGPLGESDAVIELVMADASLHKAMLVYSRHVFFLSIITLGLGFFLYPALFVIVAGLYFGTTLGGRFQASLGMRAMGIAMVRVDGRPMDFLTAIVHLALFWILNSVLTPLILLAGLFIERSRLIHDLLLGTVIVRTA